MPLPARFTTKHPRHRLTPAFRDAIAQSPLPLWQLAKLAGYRHPQVFSNVLHAHSVLPSRLLLLRTVAVLVQFNPNRIVADPADAADYTDPVDAPLLVTSVEAIAL